MSTSEFVCHVTCPEHDDDNASMAVYSDGHGFCFACWKLFPHIDVPQDAPARKAREHWHGPSFVPWSLVYTYETLLAGELKDRKVWLAARGLTGPTIRRLHLGHTGGAFSIPVWDEREELLTVRFRRDDLLTHDTDRPKYWGLRGRNDAVYYGLWQPLAGQTVILTEGELDAARLMQEFWPRPGLTQAALGLTNGSKAMSLGLADQLKSRGVYRVLVAFDADDAGRAGAQKALDAFRAVGLPAWKLGWRPTWGKDITEILQSVGFHALQERINSGMSRMHDEVRDQSDAA